MLTDEEKGRKMRVTGKQILQLIQIATESIRLDVPVDQFTIPLSERKQLVSALLDAQGDVVITSTSQRSLTIPLSSLRFHARALKVFQAFGLSTIGDLVDKSEIDLSAVTQCGRVTLGEIKEVLADFGLTLKKHRVSA